MLQPQAANVENHKDCNPQKPDWLYWAEGKAAEENNIRLLELTKTFDFFLDPDSPPYITLVDGGVTDNLGLRIILSNAMLFAGSDKLENLVKQLSPLDHVVVLVVNAATTASTDIGKSRRPPSIADVLTAVNDIQLHRYNFESSSLLRSELEKWTEQIFTTGPNVQAHFIELSVEDAEDQEVRRFFNMIPTSLELEKEEVDKILQTVRRLLRANPDYVKLLQALEED